MSRWHDIIAEKTSDENILHIIFTDHGVPMVCQEINTSDLLVVTKFRLSEFKNKVLNYICEQIYGNTKLVDELEDIEHDTIRFIVEHINRKSKAMIGYIKGIKELFPTS